MTAHTPSLNSKDAHTFRSASVAEALQSVQRELGPEALIVSVRNVPGGPAWQVWRKPAVEVVALPAVSAGAAAPTPWPAPLSAAQLRPEPTLPAQAAPAAQAAQPAASRPARVVTSRELGRSESGGEAGWPVALTEVYRRLAAQGLDETLLYDLASTCATTLSPRSLEEKTRVREHLQRQLEANLRVWGSPALASARTSGSEPRVVALVGPSGCGKTTTLGKLAAYHGRSLGLRVAWICADTQRAGAIAQARAYTEALRMPLRVAYTGAELAQAVAAEKDNDLILVDTPGCNPRQERAMVELGELLTALKRRATYLVAPATSKELDLMDTSAAFGMFDLKGLICTKLDETTTLGNVYNLAWRSRLPLLYYALGPGVLDELMPATARYLTSELLGR